MVYILEFERPLHHARFYVGYCDDSKFNARMRHHQRGTGARITAAAARAGIGWQCIATFDGAGRDFERQIKRKKNTPRLVKKLRKEGVI